MFAYLVRVEGENSTNYHNASAICSEYNAFLTSISDFDEMKFISGLVGNNAYLIGLIKNDTKWFWIDNYTKLNYTNWRTSEPNSCCGMNVKCVAVNWNGIMDDQWSDIDCDNTSSINFVCKKKY
ncbi:unnamed protein product [Wuchereria bancrofti]|uniref:C-type lectin domain-containing protein n=1 Tax=Wuchereria bancrofti TaxID=6293 RepID=A0A3P7G304_WUCBA|nr:unnamed protein product [Wuchereria bancrofti]